MYLIVSSKLDPDMFPNSKYDPFIISQLSNNFQHLYDQLNQSSNNNNSSLESTSKDIISKNKDAISMLVLILALHIGVEPTLFGGSKKNNKTKQNTKSKQNKKTKRNKKTKKNTNTKKKTKRNKKTNTKKRTKKNTKKNVIKMKARRQTRKSAI